MRRGTRVGQAYVAVTADGSGINEEIVDSVDEAGPGVERAGDEHGKRYGDKFGDGFRGRLDAIRGRLDKALSDRMAKAGENSGESFSNRMTDRTKDLGTRIGARLADQISEQLGDRIEMTIASALDDVEQMMDRNHSVSRNTPRRQKDTGLDDMIGSLFGKGSRNNALNLLGSMMKNVVSLIGQGEKFAKGFADGIAQAGEGANLLQTALSGLKGGGAATSIGKGLMSITKAGPAAIVAIIAVIAAMSAMVSVAGALLAIITALSATIVSGLVGALLVLAPALLAAVAGAGLLTAAFMSMTDAQKSMLTDAFQPLKAEMVGLGQLMLQDMVPAFGTWSANLQQALLLALPLAQQLGATFAQAGNILTASFSGPGFQALATSLGIFLPGILLRLTQAFASFNNGAAGTFAALMPLVNQFAGYLQGVTERFNMWANSAQGQNAIVDFANRAVASLQSLWNFVREFSGFVFDVLFDRNAQTAGNSIFDSLADSFANLREKLAQASADGSLQKWFDDAIEFGSQLWSVVRSLVDLFVEFYDSGMLTSIGRGLEAVATALDIAAKFADPLISAVGGLALVMTSVVGPIDALIGKLGELTDKAGGALNVLKAIPVVGGWVGGLSALNSGSDSSSSGSPSVMDNINPRGSRGNGLGVLAPTKTPTSPNIDLNALIASGNNALNATSTDSGGYKAPKTPKKWQNPYVEWANSLIKDGPSEMTKVRQALNKANRTFQAAIRDANDTMVETLRTENKNAAKAIRSAAMDDSAEGVTSTLQNVIESMRTQAANTAQQIRASAKSTADGLRNGADSVVQGARSALNSAASSLAGASTPEAAKKALAAVATAQKALDAAEKAADKMDKKAAKLVAKAKAKAKKLREQTAAANAILAAQEVLTTGNVNALVAGQKVANATLADFAEARSQVAAKIEAANQKLAEAIQIRDSYRSAISDSIKAFGALTTAQAQVIDGVTQALTANDIVSNLQDRLDKIKAFQSNLRILLAQGLSDAAYKQILDMGVEGGSAYVDALVAGGQGAVGATNDLVGQIGGIADQLGLDASNRLYQAGVDAAQGLVDGLMSLSSQLDTAATRLGETIAAAVKKALGINSPSRRMIGYMDNVGDGAVIGLDNQSDKVSRAARRFSSNIAVSPEVAAYAALQGQSPTVSGNGEKIFDLTVITPTEEPKAVVMEVMNEITGRL